MRVLFRRAIGDHTVKSLDKGASRIVPIKMPADMKAELQRICEHGETLSAFVRIAAAREATRRSRAKKRRRKK